jgi:hypothetical protein
VKRKHVSVAKASCNYKEEFRYHLQDMERDARAQVINAVNLTWRMLYLTRLEVKREQGRKVITRFLFIIELHIYMHVCSHELNYG